MNNLDIRKLLNTESDAVAIKRITKDNSLTEIEVKRGILGLLPVFLSAMIISYGVYLFALDTGVDENYYALIGAFSAFGAILFIERHRTDYFKDGLETILRNKITQKEKTPFFGWTLFILITLVFVTLDVWSGIQGGTSLYNRYINHGVENSIEYKEAKSIAKSGVKETELYLNLMEAWRKDKEAHYADCNARWRLPTYRTKNAQCKDSFSEPMPTKAEIKVSDAIEQGELAKITSSIKDKANIVMMYLPYIIASLSLLATLLALIVIINSFREKLRELTPLKIEELRNRIDLIEEQKKEHLHKSTEAQVEAIRKRNLIDIDLEKLTYEEKLLYYKNLKDRKKREIQKIPRVPSVSDDYVDVDLVTPKIDSDEHSNNEEYIKHEAVAKHQEEQPIGFKVGDKANSKPTNIVTPKPPTFHHESGYFDDGYDLTVAIYALFDFGAIEADEPLLSNPQMLKKYNECPYKRNELKLNQISSLVKAPLKEAGLIKQEKGKRDIALYNLDEVIAELGLLAYGAEITAQDYKEEKKKFTQTELQKLVEGDKKTWFKLLDRIGFGKIIAIFGTINSIEYGDISLFIQDPKRTGKIEYIVQDGDPTKELEPLSWTFYNLDESIQKFKERAGK